MPMYCSRLQNFLIALRAFAGLGSKVVPKVSSRIFVVVVDSDRAEHRGYSLPGYRLFRHPANSIRVRQHHHKTGSPFFIRAIATRSILALNLRRYHWVPTLFHFQEMNILVARRAWLLTPSRRRAPPVDAPVLDRTDAQHAMTVRGLAMNA